VFRLSDKLVLVYWKYVLVYFIRSCFQTVIQLKAKHSIVNNLLKIYTNNKTNFQSHWHCDKTRRRWWTARILGYGFESHSAHGWCHVYCLCCVDTASDMAWSPRTTKPKGETWGSHGGKDVDVLFCVVTPSGLEGRHQRFRGKYFLHLQGQRINCGS
jgi:hypothetical protein